MGIVRRSCPPFTLPEWGTPADLAAAFASGWGSREVFTWRTVEPRGFVSKPVQVVEPQHGPVQVVEPKLTVSNYTLSFTILSAELDYRQSFMEDRGHNSADNIPLWARNWTDNRSYRRSSTR